MKKIRLGMVGMGGIAQHHLGYLGDIKEIELTAICDIDKDVLAKNEKAVNEKFRSGMDPVKTFIKYQDLIKSGLCDAVLICTPHYFHPPIAIAAFKAGMHVLTEKPIGVYSQQAKKMIAEHKKHKGLVFAAMFQQRTTPVYKKAKEMIDAGALGEMRLFTWNITTWFRSQSYYDSGGWRATWEGEGGGVLLNQCPHTLDMMTWLVGTPSQVIAQASLGKYHHIEVEDEVNALLRYSNGAVGHFVSSTAIIPGTNRLEIVGDRATMVIEDNSKLTLKEVECGSMQKYNETTSERFKRDGVIESVYTFNGVQSGGHHVITRNFVDAVLRGAKLIAPGEEGLKGLSLGNAFLMSGLKKKPVDIPFKDKEFKDLLDELIAKSTFKKKVKKGDAGNLKGSF